MNWAIKLSSVAEKRYKKLDKNIKKLKGFYRLRVEDYRVIFSILTDEKIIAVVNIVPRG